MRQAIAPRVIELLRQEVRKPPYPVNGCRREERLFNVQPLIRKRIGHLRADTQDRRGRVRFGCIQMLPDICRQCLVIIPAQPMIRAENDHHPGVPPLKWSTNWDSLIPFRRTRDGRKARQTRRDRAEASPS